MAEAAVLIVGHNRRNVALLCQCLAGCGHHLQAVHTLDQVDPYLDTAPVPRLALVDVSGFDRRLWPRCARLRQLGVPVLLISHRRSVALDRASKAYARALLVKPLRVAELLAQVDAVLGAPA